MGEGIKCGPRTAFQIGLSDDLFRYIVGILQAEKFIEIPVCFVD